MDWNNVKKQYPDRWVIVKAVKAHTDSNGKRDIREMEVVDTYGDGFSAYRKYKELHQIDSQGEYYYIHTSREKLDISEEIWIGIRLPYATSA